MKQEMNHFLFEKRVKLQFKGELKQEMNHFFF